MAMKMGGDLVLQLLHEFREHKRDYKQFKNEMLELKQDYKHFKTEMLEFKQDYMGFKQAVVLRLDVLQQTNVETLSYLKHIVHILQPMKDQVQDHEQRLTKLEET